MKNIFTTAILLAMLTLTVTIGTNRVFAAEPQTKCPIMGYEINKKLFADYDGKRIYFCCASCPDEFKKDPEKYIKRLEDQGIEFEKTPAR